MRSLEEMQREMRERMEAKRPRPAICRNGHPMSAENLYYDGRCKICVQAKHKEKNRVYRLTHTAIDMRCASYGITTGRFLQMLADQRYRCAVCHEAFTVDDMPHIDHDHSCCAETKCCGKCVRGLVHRSCNTRIGFYENSYCQFAEWNALVASYLRAYSDRRQAA